MVFRLLRANASQYTILALLACFLGVFQIRLSLDTIHTERNLDYFVPFTLQQFSDRINDRDGFQSFDYENPFSRQGETKGMWRGDQLVSVNGRPFDGMSVYLTELKRRQTNRSYPLVVLVRSGTSPARDPHIRVPACTCGAPTLFQSVVAWLVPPVFCELLGLTVAFWRPRAALAWAFLVLMLSLAQLQLWPFDSYVGFWQTANPMAWDDWFRVPAVAYLAFVRAIWPAALLAAVAFLRKPNDNARKCSLGLSAVFIAYPVLQSVLAVAWSEYFRPLASLFRFQEHYQTEFLIVVMVAMALIAWFTSRILGGTLIGALLLVLLGLYSRPSGPTMTWDPRLLLYFTTPPIHNTPELMKTFFCTTCLAGLLLASRRYLRRMEVAAAALCVPFAVALAGCFGGYWYIFQGFEGLETWGKLVLLSTALGLGFGARSLMLRTGPNVFTSMGISAQE